MKREEFLEKLRNSLQGLPAKDIEDRISFYNESISDRMEDGKSEEEAIADIGSVDQVVERILNETPLNKIVKEKMRPKRRLTGWEVVLIVLGFPLWLPLLTTFFVLVFVSFLLVWVGVIVTYSTQFALCGSCAIGLAAFSSSVLNGAPNIYYLGIALVSLGGAVFLGFGCFGITKATIKLSRCIVLGIKKLFVGRR